MGLEEEVAIGGDADVVGPFDREVFGRAAAGVAGCEGGWVGERCGSGEEGEDGN